MAHRYVVTAAQNATPVHPGFWRSLRRYCKARHAQLIVVPIRYKNPTSIWTRDQEADDWWATETLRYQVNERLHITPKCAVLADVRIQPTAADPLAGLDGLTAAQSVIVGHPQQALKCVATPAGHLPRLLMSTGVCTVANYSDSKAGARAAHWHRLGARIVEVEEDTGIFHTRRIVGMADGSFQDLTSEYTPEETRSTGGIATLVMGDVHADYADPDAVRATFEGPGSIVQRLRPQLLGWHDVLDCYAGSHHHRHSPITQFRKAHSGKDDLEAEINRCLAFIDKHTPPWATNLIVPSNHIDHLSRWLEETDPREDHTNALLWARLFTATREAALRGERCDPFTYLAKQRLRCADRCIFLNRDEAFSVHGVDLSQHGDQGPNGTRGSLKAFALAYLAATFGHSHTPGEYLDAVQVGTLSIMGMEYVRGPSSWLHSNCAQYKNGARTLINVIDGRWTA